MIREAKQVMADGNARLLLLGSPDQFGTAVPEGMTVVPISCQSEGALEMYIEPVLPVPHLVIVGSSPMTQHARRAGQGAGLAHRPGQRRRSSRAGHAATSGRWSSSPPRGTATRT